MPFIAFLCPIFAYAAWAVAQNADSAGGDLAPGVATLWLTGSETGAELTKPKLPAASGGGGGGDPACTPDAGDCCSFNGTPGCDDPDCCNAVCDIDPFCCSVDKLWDDFCAATAVGLCPVCCPLPTMECFAELLVVGDDDDDDSESSEDAECGSGSGCTLEVSWIVDFGPEFCAGSVEAVIAIGCDVIPVENGQVVELNCAAVGDDDDDDQSSDLSRSDSSDDGGGCGFSFVRGVLVINSDVAPLIVSATNADGNTAECAVDLWPLRPVAGRR